MADPKERRRRERKVSQVEARLSFEGIPAEVIAILVDESETGFRARHGYLAITGNQEIGFRTNNRSGRACAVWNRILGEEVETGFVIVESA